LGAQVGYAGELVVDRRTLLIVAGPGHVAHGAAENFRYFKAGGFQIVQKMVGKKAVPARAVRSGVPRAGGVDDDAVGGLAAHHLEAAAPPPTEGVVAATYW
jgi:hypothetical protein